MTEQGDVPEALLILWYPKRGFKGRVKREQRWRGFLVLHPKLCSLSREGHYTLRSRSAEEHSFSLVLCFQRAAEVLSKDLFSVPVLWAIATYQVVFAHFWVLLGFIWYWTEISAALQTQPMWSLADA